jgi:hypothetical protein
VSIPGHFLKKGCSLILAMVRILGAELKIENTKKYKKSFIKGASECQYLITEAWPLITLLSSNWEF